MSGNVVIPSVRHCPVELRALAKRPLLKPLEHEAAFISMSVTPSFSEAGH
jgi:hypothetical protein